MYSARYFDVGKYIIGDEEYGYNLARIVFTDEAREKFSDELLQSMADAMAVSLSASVSDKDDCETKV